APRKSDASGGPTAAACDYHGRSQIGRCHDDDPAMHDVHQMNRRSFLASVAATGGALALGFDIPFGIRRLCADDGAPEIPAWIVIEPDDTVIIRLAKSEMGQG